MVSRGREVAVDVRLSRVTDGLFKYIFSMVRVILFFRGHEAAWNIAELVTLRLG